MRFAPCLLLAVILPGCVTYDFEHEIWLRVDGTGSINVAGRPALWGAFKGVTTAEAARALFTRAGLHVRRVRLSERGGRPHLFLAADFDDLSRLGSAFPDLHLELRKDEGRLQLAGAWSRPPGTPDPPAADRDGLLAVRFHLPSKVYTHANAFAGVERGNILSWRMGVAEALRGDRIEIGATLDPRSLLGSTLRLFATATVAALVILGGTLIVLVRNGRRAARPTNRGRPCS